jgi:hypothetical protein
VLVIGHFKGHVSDFGYEMIRSSVCITLLTGCLAALPEKGTKALTYMATSSDKQLVLTLLCSLLNTVSVMDEGAELWLLTLVCRH